MPSADRGYFVPTADGRAIGTCTLYDLDGPIGWSSVCAVANQVMGASS